MTRIVQPILHGLAVGVLLAAVGASSADAGPREQAKCMHDRLVGVPPSASVLDSMAAAIAGGDPVAAARECVRALVDRIGNRRVGLVATTGSARELVGAYLGTAHVYNEISAHAAGATHETANGSTSTRMVSGVLHFVAAGHDDVSRLLKAMDFPAESVDYTPMKTASGTGIIRAR